MQVLYHSHKYQIKLAYLSTSIYEFHRLILHVTLWLYTLYGTAARMRLAAGEKAEAEKIIQIKKAEGEAESKYLAGVAGWRSSNRYCRWQKARRCRRPPETPAAAMRSPAPRPRQRGPWRWSSW
jgi:hypothetical protein